MVCCVPSRAGRATRCIRRSADAPRTIILTHKLNNYTMQTAIDYSYYKQLLRIRLHMFPITSI
ncbi:hypothetical protein B0H17DRAFT_1042986 [Mycena rosella]|uniref:Uncharacterized protein n=1 Tax=Mycena rosella TaxID=1033263 RepID=A0AAD7GN40_MYCRO|nr:hypothetical protein B0H17DRAFT_1042986 [Mycena rosella]